MTVVMSSPTIQMMISDGFWREIYCIFWMFFRANILFENWCQLFFKKVSFLCQLTDFFYFAIAPSSPAFPFDLIVSFQSACLFHGPPLSLSPTPHCPPMCRHWHGSEFFTNLNFSYLNLHHSSPLMHSRILAMKCVSHFRDVTKMRRVAFQWDFFTEHAQ